MSAPNEEPKLARAGTGAVANARPQRRGGSDPLSNGVLATGRFRKLFWQKFGDLLDLLASVQLLAARGR
jgi:hypothetical protein